MDLPQLAASQHGVFAHHQLADANATDRDLERLVRRGSVERVLPEVYRFVGQPTTFHQRLSAATLSIPGSFASHRAAASLWGLRGFDAAPVELVVARWARRARRLDGIIVHESKDLRPVDASTRAGIATTTLVRTLVDLPAVTTTRRAGDALDHAIRRDASILRRVQRRHLEVARRGRRGTTALRGLIAERLDGVELVDSGFERLAVEMVRDAGLPTPVSQHKVVLPGEDDAYLDLAWPEPLVALECDSYEFHSDRRAFAWDRKRRRLLLALGWTVLEATLAEVRARDRQLLRQLHQLVDPGNRPDPTANLRR